MRVAIVQNEPVFGKCAANARKLATLMADRAKADSSDPPGLYVLPELCYSGYQFLSRAEAMAIADGSEAEEALSILAESAKALDAAVVLGFAEPSGGKLFNSALCLGPEGPMALYRKTHLFYKEKEIFDPGDSGFSIFEWRGLRVGMAVCFDWFFPESFRTLALKGADLIAHPSNLVLPYCQRADYARAVENRVYIATANRSGSEDRVGERLIFSGESVALDPSGEYLLRLSGVGEATGSFFIDPDRARSKRLNEFNDLFADRRPDFYL